MSSASRSAKSSKDRFRSDTRSELTQHRCDWDPQSSNDFDLRLFEVRRAHIEAFARELEARGRARATIARRLGTITCFYRYAEQEGLIEHSPAVHLRRPKMDYESHASGPDRNELGAMLVAAGLAGARDHALISLLALNGLRVSEAIGAQIENLALERGHRTLTVLRKGGKTVVMPWRRGPPGPSISSLANGSKERSCTATTARTSTGTRRPESCAASRRPPVPGTRRCQAAVADRITFCHTLLMAKAISVRLDDDAERALRILEATGLSRSAAIRSALLASAERVRKRSELAAEAAALEADEADRAEMLSIASMMETMRAAG